MANKLYRVIKRFAHQHIHCDAGSTIALSAEQAEFLRHGGFVEPAEAVDDVPVAEPVEAANGTDDDHADSRRRKGARA